MGCAPLGSPAHSCACLTRCPLRTSNAVFLLSLPAPLGVASHLCTTVARRFRGSRLPTGARLSAGACARRQASVVSGTNWGSMRFLCFGRTTAGLSLCLVGLAWGIFRLKAWAWWGSLLFVGLLACSSIMTLAMTSYAKLLARMNFPPAEMEFLDGIPSQGVHLDAFFGLPLTLTLWRSWSRSGILTKYADR